MTPFFFFFTLCVSYAGADNCDYSWVVVDDLDSAGLYDSSTKTVYVSPDRITEVITHEVKHIICELEYVNIELEGCNFNVDTEYTVQGIRPENPSLIPDNTMSGKMIDSLGMIGKIKNFSGNLMEGYNE